MRYRLDANGYVESVFWGCYSNGCAEYTGTVPYGYTDLVDWSENALINAYYLVDGNLVLDNEKLADLEAKIEQETIDNEPLYRKDLYGSVDTLNGTYTNETAKGEVLALTNVKRINPRVKITDIECYDYSKIDIVTQGKNMLKNDAITETIEGVKFTRFINGVIKISGTATADIEYNLSGSSDNTTSLFALKKNKDYYLNIGGLDCELKYYDGTNHQVYTGASGVINLSENKEVTQVLIKIPNGTTIEQTIYPMLEYGTSASEYEEYKHRILSIDFSEYIDKDPLYPSELNIKHSALKTGTTKSGVSKALNEVVETTESLYPSDDLFPRGSTVDYIYIENGSVYISVNGVQKYLMKANVNLFDGFNTVYTMQDTKIEMTYCINNLKLEGTITKNNNFKVLEDGSIEAHNGYFSGKIEADSGDIGGFSIGETELYSEHIGTYTYTENDCTKIRNYVIGTAQLTEKEKVLYDVDEDGKVTSVDYAKIKNAIASGNPTLSGRVELSSKNMYSMMRIKDNKGNITTEIGIGGVKTTGNVSAGTMTCNGNISTTGLTSENGDVKVGVDSAGNPLIRLSKTSGTVHCVSVNQTSLEENKKNFEIFENALPILNDIDIYRYNFKIEEDGHKKHLGFVIGKDFNYSSEITTVDENGKEIGVDNYSMTSLCLQAIKELSNKVEVLENKIKEMEER